MPEQKPKPRATPRSASVPTTLEIAVSLFAAVYVPGGGRTKKYYASEAFDAAEALLTEHRRRTA